MYPSLRLLAGVAAVSFSALVLSGCDTPDRVSGTVTANSSIRIVTPGGNKHVLTPGSYKAVVRVEKGVGQVFITSGAKQINFKVPGFSGSESNIKISAAAMRQEFGLSGRIYGTQNPFDRTVNQSCVYDVERDWVCRERDHKKECDWETCEIPGTQRVREIGYATYKNIDINLVNTSNQKIGNFRGTYSYGDTVTSRDYVTGCMRDWDSSRPRY